MRNTTILTATAICFSTVATVASAEKMILATDFPPTHYVSKQQVEPLMQCITEGTNGAIEFDYFPSGQLVKRDEGIEALQKGLANITSSVIPNETETVPMQNLTGLPGLGASATESTSAWRKALNEGGVLADEVKNANVFPISLLLLPPYQMAGKRTYANVADWKGQKVRSTGGSLNFLVESMGAVAVEMNANDMYTAVQRGTVDATIIGLAAVKSYSIQEVVTHISGNASLGTSASWLGMKLDAYNALPADQQKVIADCGLKAEQAITAWLDEQDKKLLEEYAGLGIEIYELSPEQLAEFSKSLAAVEGEFVKRLLDRGLPAQEALAEYKAALGK